MMELEYQCRQCHTQFNSDQETDFCSPEDDIKCPSCSSTDIEIAGNASSISELLIRLMGSGGG